VPPIAAATPSLPLPPMPTGKLTCVETPAFDFHYGLTLARKSLNA